MADAAASLAAKAVLLKSPCSFFAAGNCVRGKKCRFSHDGITPAVPAPASPATKPVTKPAEGKIATAVAAKPEPAQLKARPVKTAPASPAAKPAGVTSPVQPHAVKPKSAVHPATGTQASPHATPASVNQKIKPRTQQTKPAPPPPPSSAMDDEEDEPAAPVRASQDGDDDADMAAVDDAHDSDDNAWSGQFQAIQTPIVSPPVRQQPVGHAAVSAIATTASAAAVNPRDNSRKRRRQASPTPLSASSTPLSAPVPINPGAKRARGPGEASQARETPNPVAVRSAGPDTRRTGPLESLIAITSAHPRFAESYAAVIHRRGGGSWVQTNVDAPPYGGTELPLVIGLDCEMVQTTTDQSALARFTLVALGHPSEVRHDTAGPSVFMVILCSRGLTSSMHVVSRVHSCSVLSESHHVGMFRN